MDNIEVELSLDHALPLVTGDASRLQQALFNLVLNAMEASSDGGKVKVRTKAHDGVVEILVEDRGCGLKATAKQCLQPFFTTKSNGTGLGLAVCAKIVQSHGGTLDLSNRDGGGCSARVVLPGPECSTGE